MSAPKSGQVCDTCQRIESRVEEIHNLLTGGDSPENGVLIKLDRLTQESQRRKDEAARRETWVRLLAAGAVGSIGLSIWNLVTGHFGSQPPTNGIRP